MPFTNDTSVVRRHDSEHLRRFLDARRRADRAEMRQWWDELVIDFFDRMDGLVAAAHKGRLSDEEHDLAVAMSMTRFSTNLITTFRGRSMGELVNAAKTLARGICIDVQRGSVRERRLEGPSLDAGWGDEPDAPSPRWEADEAARRYAQDCRSAEIEDFLSWAMPQVNPERRRVLELSFHGAEVAEIAGELGITADNAYQRRSRAMKDLKKLKESYDA